MDKIRCQSCGMPLGEGYFGSNADGAPNADYCKYCYQNGQFTEPRLSLTEMINISVHHMITELQYSEEEARKLARETIPHLKRWS